MLLDKVLALGLVIVLVVAAGIVLAVYAWSPSLDITPDGGSNCHVESMGRTRTVRQDGSAWTADASIHYCNIKEVPVDRD
jgi:hypothetical protein